jgi:hypothetical protein
MDASTSLFFLAAIKEMKRVIPLFFIAFMQLLSPSSGLAHSVFNGYIHHRINLKIDSNNIDVTVELFFHAHQSETERSFMDGDRDGRIMPGEIREYLKLKMAQFKNGIQLSIDGRPLRVMALYRPDLKLHNVRSVKDHPHSLKLYYFARTPRQLRPGSIITLEDKLWRSTPAICSLSMQSKGPMRFAVQDRSSSLLSPRSFGGRRLIQIRTLAGTGSKSREDAEEKENVPDSDSSKSEKNKTNLRSP